MRDHRMEWRGGERKWDFGAEGEFWRRGEKSANLLNCHTLYYHFLLHISVLLDGDDVIVGLDVDLDGADGKHDSGGSGHRGGLPVRLGGAAQRQQHAGRGHDALAPHDDLHGGRRGRAQMNLYGHHKQYRNCIINPRKG